MEILANKTEYKKRLATCECCPHLNKINQCTKCGCFVILKAKISLQECPEGFWPKVTPLAVGN